MKHLGPMIPALALALASQSAPAQTAPAQTSPQAAATTPAPTTPAPSASPADNARLAAARVTVDHIFPAGTYAKLMGAPMDKLMDGIMGGVGQMPLREIAQMGGTDADSLAKLDKTTINDIMDIYDPAFHQRTTAMMHVMMGEMGTLMSQIEPSVRDGLAEAYAARFTAEQLADMNRFFASPSGHAYASNALLIQMDPAVMAKMQGFMPLMMKALPDIMKKVAAANAALPKPRTWADMTPAQHQRLAQLLGVSQEKLAEQAKAKEAKPAN